MEIYTSHFAQLIIELICIFKHNFIDFSIVVCYDIGKEKIGVSSMDLNLLGSRIKELRLERGLTQSEFANILSVSFQAVSSWERGIAPPDIENLMNIAKYFGVLVDSLLSPISEDLYLGIDGGGTKTEFVLVNSSGVVVERIIKSGSNPNDTGFSAAESVICEGVCEILVKYPSVKSIFSGISGISVGNYAEKLRSSLKKICPKTKIEVLGDVFNLFALNDKANMAVISGTGSVVFCKSADGYRRVGGWGHLFDGAGSAYDIGSAAVSAALGEEDFSEKASYLTELLRKKFNTSTVWEHINELYKGGKSYIAKLAPIVFDAYKAGDEKAAKIIDNNAKRLAKLIEAGRDIYSGGSVAIASGGVFEHFYDIMRSHISNYTDVSIVTSDLPPIYGAAKNALIYAGCNTPENFYENFKKSYGDK